MRSKSQTWAPRSAPLFGAGHGKKPPAQRHLRMELGITKDQRKTKTAAAGKRQRVRPKAQIDVDIYYCVKGRKLEYNATIIWFSTLSQPRPLLQGQQIAPGAPSHHRSISRIQAYLRRPRHSNQGIGVLRPFARNSAPIFACAS